jgi:1,4-alpha-glucan branching enzyme
MVAMARRHPDAGGELGRALNQMARELLLAQSSDWAFIMTTGTTVPYAIRRTRDHINRFTGLYEQVAAGRVDGGTLHEIEWRDSIFQELDYRVYA